MKENKFGIIFCSFIVIISSFISLFAFSNEILVNYMLALFGSGILSLLICSINYFVFKKNMLNEIIHDDYFLNLQSILQIELTKETPNTLSKSQLIYICTFVRTFYKKTIDSLDLYLSSVFLKNTKGSKIIMEYRNGIEKACEDFNDLYMFITTSEDIQLKRYDKLLSDHLLKITTETSYVDKKNDILNHYFKHRKKLLENDFNYDEFNKNYIKKLYNASKK